jgi:transposase
MAMLSFGGIDVSKDRLDVMVLPEEQCASVSNGPTGWANLIERLRNFSIAAIGIEASGGYERGVMRALLVAGMPVRRVNPFKLRQFARASGVLAKNDPLDARMIASFVAIMPTRPAQPPAPAVERLAEMLAVRRQLSAEKVAAENASRLLEDAMQGCARSRSPRLALSRAVVTSAGSSVPCSRRGCRCDVSTRPSFVSSPAPAACWPRTTASMRG